MSGGGGEESPKSRLKFLCSHGGKILPRPPDGQLKYVGGETRAFAVSTDINFSELMKKLTSLTEGDMVLKYQVIPEDLETLISVKNDADLHNMIAEYNRHDAKFAESCGTPRLRTFLFPSNPSPTENQSAFDTFGLDRRYIKAINGIPLPNPNKMRRCPSITLNRPPLNGGASAGSSPKGMDAINPIAFVSQNYHNKEMHKVYSSPSLYNLGHQNQNHYIQQQPYYQSSRLQGSGPHSGPHSGPLPSPYNTRLVTSLSTGRNDIGRYQQLGPTQTRYYSPSEPKRVSCSSGCVRCKRVSGEFSFYKSGEIELGDRNLPGFVKQLLD
ncbi:hypothetical protein GIB67_004519 [Kingdonia uniflora]|uniref:PB1 domain-containing protein n=1 Tax=Kingdonia uniflora TaxID=39325 RepID=A0A7J7NJG8_9MAGN|nr:hypothetical protein GIB67_004519 [Kingdonia uniflora]